jgi:hypothetical protein
MTRLVLRPLVFKRCLNSVVRPIGACGNPGKSSKKARYRPPNPDKKPLGDPKLRKLNDQERKKLNALAAQKATA